MFCSVFRFSHLKTSVFRFCCLARFAGFPQFSLWFSVFVNGDNGFLDFSVQCIQYGFSGFAKKGIACSRAKTVIPRDNLYSVLLFLLGSFRGMDDKPSLLSSRYLSCIGCLASRL